MVENQAYLFLVFSLTGILIGILFDFFRVSRKLFKTSDFITYIEDILFWILTGILVLYAIWFFNDGEIRFFMLLGLIMGIIIYLLTLSNIFTKTSFFLLDKFKSIIIYFIKIFSTILRPIYSFFCKLFYNIKNILRKIAKRIKNLVNFENKRRNFKKNAE